MKSATEIDGLIYSWFTKFTDKSDL